MIAPGPSRDQSTLRAIVSLAMTSPAMSMATSPTRMAEAFGPLGRLGASGKASLPWLPALPRLLTLTVLLALAVLS
jgi:hypothetical protein